MNRAFEPDISAVHDHPVPAGALDDLTIMRYAHIYRDRTSGGVEQYLRHLDRGLLQRHRLTILQMHLVQMGEDAGVQVEDVGIGRIVWIPATVMQSTSRLADLWSRVRYLIDQPLGRSCGQGKGVRSPSLASAPGALLGNIRHLRYKAAVFSDHLSGFLKTQKVGILALHWMNYDAVPLVEQAYRSGVPYVFINHFDNERLSLPAIRKCLDRAAAIGAVSARGIPEDLRARCCTLSDAVDTDFFAPEKARGSRIAPRPTILLPARIAEGKGHRDLIEAARILIARGIDFILCFVGAVDSPPLDHYLRGLAAAAGVESRVLFLGERSAEEIRIFYATSTVVVLPSYSEGLSRVILEAQSMEKPVVAYDIGGMSDSVLPDETGFLVKTGDVNALADKLAFLLENETACARMGRRGRQFVSTAFSISSLLHRHETFYLGALARAQVKS